MKETKHTPGPWKIQGNGTLLHPVSGRPLTTTRIETSLGTFEVMDETNEPGWNAILIASAPTLLSENQRLREALERIDCIAMCDGLEAMKPFCELDTLTLSMRNTYASVARGNFITLSAIARAALEGKG